MKTILKLASCFLICVFVIVACGNPEKKKAAAEKKLAANTEQARTNQMAQVHQGVALVQATEHLATLAPSSPFWDVAKLTLGLAHANFQAADVMPESALVFKYQIMVDNLLSTNAQLVVQGSNTMAAARAVLAATEHRADTLDAEKSLLQKKLDAVNAENAAMAGTWSKITHVFWWFVWGVVGVIVFRIIGAMIPAPYDSAFFIVDHLGGLVGRFFLKLLPKAAATAGVVSQTAFESLVKGVGNARAQLKAQAAHADEKAVAPSAVLAALDSHLSEATQAITPLIAAARAKVNA